MMTINEFIQKYRKVRKLGLDMTTGHTPHVVCKDGFKMSVQASGSHSVSYTHLTLPTILLV